MRRWIMVLATIAVVVCLHGSAQAQETYTIVNMNTVWAAELEEIYVAAGHSREIARGIAVGYAYKTEMFCINDAGQMAGNYNSQSPSYPVHHAIRWDPVAGFQDLAIPGLRSLAKGINDLGQVVGQGSHSKLTGNGSYAFLWDSADGVRDLGGLSDVTKHPVWATAVNNLGQVAGQSYVGDEDAPGFIWDSVNGMQEIGTLGGRFTHPKAINDLGQVVGYSELEGESPHVSHAFLWDPINGLQDLHSSQDDYSQASDINNLGQIVGSNGGEACVWEDGQVRFLDLQEKYPDADYSDGDFINDAGQIVGNASFPDAPRTFFLWEEETGVHDFQDLLAADSSCRFRYILDFNNHGCILVSAIDADSRPVTLLLKPIPEPSTMVAVLGGLASLGLICLRRRGHSNG